MDLLNINPFPHLGEREGRKKPARAGGEGEKRGEGGIFKSKSKEWGFK